MKAIRECRLHRRPPAGAAWKSSRDFRSVVIGDARGSEFRGRKLHEESRTCRLIVLDMNRAAMLCHDASGDGQAQAGSAVFGGEVRKEKFVFVLWRDALAGVGHANLDGFRVGMRARRNKDFP